jgi:hypothetical protein
MSEVVTAFVAQGVFWGGFYFLWRITHREDYRRSRELAAIPRYRESRIAAEEREGR